MENLDNLRKEINIIDDEMVKLFCKRLEISKRVGAVKKAGGTQVLDSDRENNIIKRLTENKSAGISGYIKELYNTIFTISRNLQL